MAGFHHVILRNGRYQLLALSPYAHAAADQVTGYVVVNLAGDVVRQERTLPQARAWMDRLIEQERIAQTGLASQVRDGPLCR